jgi:hypothetical protein
MAVPPEVESLPDWGQKILGGLAFLGVFGAMVTRFLGGKAEEPHKTVVLEQAETADLAIIRKMLEELEPLPEVLDEIKRVISNQDRNYGLLERQSLTLEKLNARLDALADNQGRLLAGIERLVSQVDPNTAILREVVETLRRQDRATEMREAMEKAMRRTEHQVPQIK